MSKCKNTKEKLNSLSLNDLMLLHHFVRKGYSCLIFLFESYTSNPKLLSKFSLSAMDREVPPENNLEEHS